MLKSFSNELKKRSVIDAGRCINCIALRYVARNCSFRPSVVSVDQKPEINMALHCMKATARRVHL